MSAALAQAAGEEPPGRSPAATGASWVATRYIVEVGSKPGLGLAFLPEPSYLETVATGVNFDQVPNGVVLLEAVSADVDPASAAGSSWESPISEMRVTPAVQARAILAEVAAASAIARDPSDPAYAFQVRLTLAAAMAKADFAVARMKDETGLFHPVRISAGSVDLDPDPAPMIDQLLMVEALARLSFALGPDAGFVPWFLEPAVALVERLDGSELAATDERAQLIIAVTALEQSTGDLSSGPDLATRLRADLRPSVLNRVSDRMWALRAIAVSATDNESAKPAHTVGRLVLADVGTWLDAGEPTRVTTASIALAVAALDDWRTVADQADRLAIDMILDRLLEEVVGASAMIRSSLRPYSWPVEGAGGDSPRPDWVEDHIPPVETAPLIADAIERSGTDWLAGEGFDPASAYALSAALVDWEASLLITTTSTGDETEDTIEVAATDFALTPAQLEIEAGSEVTIRLVNRGVVPHNFAIPALGVLVEAGPGGSATTVMAVPAEVVTYDILCSLPGHYESGMRGTLVVTTGASAEAAPTTVGSTSSPGSVASVPEAPEPGDLASSPPASDDNAVPGSDGWTPGPEVLAIGALVAVATVGLGTRRLTRGRGATGPP
jgi:plastocyanin